jgi:hypothetical protein
VIGEAAAELDISEYRSSLYTLVVSPIHALSRNGWHTGNGRIEVLEQQLDSWPRKCA